MTPPVQYVVHPPPTRRPVIVLLQASAWVLPRTTVRRGAQGKTRVVTQGHPESEPGWRLSRGNFTRGILRPTAYRRGHEDEHRLSMTGVTPLRTSRVKQNRLCAGETVVWFEKGESRGLTVGSELISGAMLGKTVELSQV